MYFDRLLNLAWLFKEFQVLRMLTSFDVFFKVIALWINKFNLSHLFSDNKELTSPFWQCVCKYLGFRRYLTSPSSRKRRTISQCSYFSCVVYFTTLSAFQNIQGGAEVTWHSMFNKNKTTSCDFGATLYRGLLERWMERLWTEGIVA